MPADSTSGRVLPDYTSGRPGDRAVPSRFGGTLSNYEQIGYFHLAKKVDTMVDRLQDETTEGVRTSVYGLFVIELLSHARDMGSKAWLRCAKITRCVERYVVVCTIA